MIHNKDLLKMNSEIHCFSMRGNTNFFPASDKPKDVSERALLLGH